MSKCEQNYLSKMADARKLRWLMKICGQKDVSKMAGKLRWLMKANVGKMADAGKLKWLMSQSM